MVFISENAFQASVTKHSTLLQLVVQFRSDAEWISYSTSIWPPTKTPEAIQKEVYNGICSLYQIVLIQTW